MSNLPNSSGRIYADIGEYHIETNYRDTRVSCAVTKRGVSKPLYEEADRLSVPNSDKAYRLALQMHDRAHAFVEGLNRCSVLDLKFPELAWALFYGDGLFSHFTPYPEAADRHAIHYGGRSVLVRITAAS